MPLARVKVTLRLAGFVKGVVAGPFSIFAAGAPGDDLARMAYLLVRLACRVPKGQAK